MPYTGEPIHDGSGFLWIGQGLVTGQELIDGGAGAVVLLQAHENITHMIADFTLATSFQVSVEEVMKVGEIDRRNAEFLPNLHIALVVPTSLGQYLASIYGQLKAPKGWTIRIFQTRTEADAWLATVVTIQG